MIKEFDRICEFRRMSPGVRGSGLSVTNPSLIPVVNDLEAIRNYLVLKFSEYKKKGFTFEISRGQTFFPSILHISILPPEQKVSNGIYVVICFDIKGRGALVGCIESVTNPQGLNTIKRKQRGKELAIDVDGLRETTKYNNAFENPKEFLVGLISEDEFLSHIKTSLDLALYHLGMDTSPELGINSRVIASRYDFEFNPSNIDDGREKVAKLIIARRGQKKFRADLLDAYESKCAVTGCNVQQVLEGAHIIPYKGDLTNHVQNGILLRSDIHLLFDLNLLTVDYQTKKIQINKSLKDSPYYIYHGQSINLPKKESDYPNLEALKIHNGESLKI